MAEHRILTKQGALNAKHGVWPAARKQPLREAAAEAVRKHREHGTKIAKKADQPEGMIIVIEANDDGDQSTFSPPETQQRKQASDEQLKQMVTALMIHGLQHQQERGITPPAKGEAIIIPHGEVSRGAF